MKILLLGDQGQIGRDLKNQIIQTENILLSFSRKDFDFTDYKTLITHISSFNPDIIINAAAYTKVDDSEENKTECYQINAEFPDFLAKYSMIEDIKLIHFSSDYVFSGDYSHPYEEDSQMNPINYYGFCKKQGDLNIINNHDKFYLLRTSWVYSNYEGNFLTTVFKSIQDRKKLNIVDDQIGVPTSSYFIAKVTMSIINNVNIDYGIYNVVPDGSASWYEFSMYIMNKLKDYDYKTVDIARITSNQLNTVAKRPENSRLNNNKLKKTNCFKIKNWRHYVDQLLQERTNNIS